MSVADTTQATPVSVFLFSYILWPFFDQKQVLVSVLHEKWMPKVISVFVFVKFILIIEIKPFYEIRRKRWFTVSLQGLRKLFDVRYRETATC